MGEDVPMVQHKRRQRRIRRAAIGAAFEGSELICALTYVAAVTALALYWVRRSTSDKLHKWVCLGYSPFVILTLMLLVMPTYWYVTTGRFAGVADDLVGLGTVLIVGFAVPLILILNLVIYACRKLENEVTQ